MKLQGSIYSISSDSDFAAYRELAASVGEAESIDLIEKAQSSFKVKIVAGDMYMTFAPLDEQQRIQSQVESTKGVAVIDFQGYMTASRNWWNFSTSDLANVIDELGKNVNVSSVLLKVNTVGGDTGNIEKLFDTVANFKTEYAKSINVLVTENCMSSGVWGFCGADKIYLADKICSMGSIGVQSIFTDYSKQLENKGISEVIIKAKQSFNKNIEVDEARKGDYTKIIKRISTKADVMINTVTKGRGNKLKLDKKENGVAEIFTGLVYIGEEAVSMGLADGIKTEKQILKELIDEANAPVFVNNIFSNIENEKAMSNNKTILEKITALFASETPETATTEQAAAQTIDVAAIAKDAATQAAQAAAALFAPQLETAQAATQVAETAQAATLAELATAQAEIARLKTAAQAAAVVGGANPSDIGANVVIQENATAMFTAFAHGNVTPKK